MTRSLHGEQEERPSDAYLLFVYFADCYESSIELTTSRSS